MEKVLKAIRVYLRLNQSEVAEHIGLSKPYVCMLEGGNRKVTTDVLERYENAFGLNLLDINNILVAIRTYDESGEEMDVSNLSENVCGIIKCYYYMHKNSVKRGSKTKEL